ncbi:MAG: hypothetical protein KDB88_01875, partial [Flavobacteriales bacterium]|nr:hypothetical protein [Flavobacteriales bacterium]
MVRLPSSFAGPVRLALFLLFSVLSSTQAMYAHPAWGIVVDDQGIIYFADISGTHFGKVWRLDLSGKAVVVLDHFHAHNVSLDADGNLVTAHGELPHVMIRVDKRGHIDTLFLSEDHHSFFGGNATYAPNGDILFG